MARLTIIAIIASLLTSAYSNRCSAQSFIGRLPADGAWARYDFVSKQRWNRMFDGDEVVDGDEMVIKGEVIIRSVGTVYVNMEAHRWIERESRMKIPALGFDADDESAREIIHVVKALVPEQELSQGKPFGDKIKKIYQSDNSFEDNKITEVDPKSAQGKNLAEGLSIPSNFKSSPIASKEIETGIGILQCMGINVSGIKEIAKHSDVEFDEVIEDETEDQVTEKENEKKQTGDDKATLKKDAEKVDDVAAAEPSGTSDNMHFSHDIYFSDQSPFGMVKTIGTITMIEKGKKMPFVEMEITLKEIGTGVKSAMPDKK